VCAKKLRGLLSSPRRIAALAVVACAALFVLLWFLPHYYPSGDGGSYLVLAKSLAHGSGFRDLRFPHPPLHTHFPFGWPLLLAPCYALFGMHPLPYHLLMGVVFVFAALALFRFFVSWTSAWVAALGAFAFISHPLLCEFSQSVLSEIPFALLLYAAFGAELKARRSPSRNTYALLMVVVLSAALVRFVGEVVVVALLLQLLAQKRWRLALLFLGLIVVKLATQYLVQGPGILSGGYFVTDFPLTRNLLSSWGVALHDGGGESAESSALAMVPQVVLNVKRLILTFIPINVAPWLYGLSSMGPVKLVGCVALSAAVGVGAVLEARRGRGFMVLVGALMVVAIITRSNSLAAYRYYALLAPLFVVLATQALRWIVDLLKLRRRFAVVTMVGGAVALGIVVVDHTLYNLQQRRTNPIRSTPTLLSDYRAALDSLVASIPADALLCAPASATTYLYSNHHTIPFAWRETGSLEQALLRFVNSKAVALVIPGWWLAVEPYDTVDFKRAVDALNRDRGNTMRPLTLAVRGKTLVIIKWL
jgi:hypothetical protein